MRRRDDQMTASRYHQRRVEWQRVWHWRVKLCVSFSIAVSRIFGDIVIEGLAEYYVEGLAESMVL